ncbi:PREDICTED: NDR1/HIN1-like protein 12 [Camelina sativa]|uniref:NDR1/HIN1-like protein 12 n=1 Tax=Camelina sativa TaxID=90675 RepID=A0ABM1QC78_CAMSA|nr:PREDICTED: NDR1/HIN1-like protein 12 [Camelina sativa]
MGEGEAKAEQAAAKAEHKNAPSASSTPESYSKEGGGGGGDARRAICGVTYKNQIITPPLPLPPLRLGHKSTVVIAPVMGGNGVPVSPEVANGLKSDEAYGVVLMRVVVLGRLRWKAGAIKTGRYGFYATCDVWLRFTRSSNGQVPLLAPSTCKVDV